jgi:hypothetical protein
MFPWLWIYAPQIAWPLSGAVSEAFSTDAFFRGIKPGAGVPAIEQQIFEQASYGKQLGWLMDVVLEAIDPATLRSSRAQASLVDLEKLAAKVERIKSDHRQDRADAAIALLDRLQTDDPQELARVLQRYQTGGALLAGAPTRP